MNINDLTVNFSYLNDRQFLAEWRWLLDSSMSRIGRMLRKPTKRPVLITAGGNVFVQDSRDSSIHLLDTTNGTLTQVSASSEEFRDRLSQTNFIENFFSIEMVQALRNSNINLSPKQVYSFKVPPVLGGQFDLNNIEPTDIEVHFSVTGQIHRQVAMVPVGGSIEGIKIK